MAKTKSAPADDFTEADPPPRRRPIGDPAPRHATLPPGETAAPTFIDWDQKGRIPAGCVLTRYVGSYRPGGSGYEVYALNEALDKIGAPIPVAKLAGWRIVSVIETTRPHNWYPVLAPKDAE